MKPWEDALEMETLLLKNDPNCFAGNVELKKQIETLYKKQLVMEYKSVFAMVIHISQIG